MKKKKLILIIRRSFLEFEYILPLIKKLTLKYELNNIFLNYKSYKNLKQSGLLYNQWKKINNNYYIQKKNHFIFYKAVNFILLKTNSSIFNNLKKKVIAKLHSTSTLLKTINIDSIKDVSVVLTEYGNFSIWIKNLYLKKERPKIVFFPSSTQINLKVGKSFGRKLYGDLLLTISKKENTYWKKFIEQKKIFPIGVPKFIELYKNNKKKNNKKNKTILFALGHSGNHWMSKENLTEIFEYFSLIKNTKIIIKMHPLKTEKFAIDLLNQYLSKNFIISKKLIIKLCSVSDLLICNKASAAANYGHLFKIPVIAMANDSKNGNYSDNIKLGLIKNSKNFEDFKKNVNLALYKTNSRVWSMQRKSFKKNYFEKKYTINQINKVIEKN